MTFTAPYRSSLGLRHASTAPIGIATHKVASPCRQPVYHTGTISNGASAPMLPGATVVPQATSRTGSSGTGKARPFSVMQSIPGLASALNYFGVNGGAVDVSGSTGGVGGASSSTVAAAGGSGAAGTAPEGAPSVVVLAEPPPPPSPSTSEAPRGGASGVLSSSSSILTAPETAVNNGHAAGVSPQNPATLVGPNSNGHAAVNGHLATNGGHLAEVHLAAVGSEASGDSLDSLDPLTAAVRVEGNIMPYNNNSGSLSLAAQIRDIASSLRQINALRVEYMERIAVQEMQLEARDQKLKASAERIQALELEAAEARQVMGQLQKANDALEAEVRRLRSEAAAATAAAAAAAAALSAPPPPLPSPISANVTPSLAAAAGPPAAIVASPSATGSPSPTPGAPSATHAAAPPSQPAHPASTHPHPLTAPPAAVAAAAPAAASVAHQTPPPAPAVSSPPAPPPPPPAPPRVPDIVLSYRSSWADAYLHFNVDGKGWTSPPGLKMEHSGNKEYTVRVPGRSLEFVLTNGAADWDSPGGGPGRNYRIDTPGEYRLHYGAVTQVKPWQP